MPRRDWNVLLGVGLLALCGCRTTATSARSPTTEATPTERPAGAPAAPPEENIDFFDMDEAHRRIVRAGAPLNKGKFKPDFDPELHEDLTENAAAKECTNQMGRAHWNQDVWHQLEASAHFDNCAFHESLVHIQQRLHDADKQVAAGNHLDALFSLGQILHALQDFYSHSDYVERASRHYARPEDVPILPVWLPEGAAALDEQVRQGLISGTVLWNLPQKCPSGTPSHGKLAKDKPGSPHADEVLAPWADTGFKAAYKLANRASLEFLQWAFRKWPLLERKCGPVVGYPVLVERRELP